MENKNYIKFVNYKKLNMDDIFMCMNLEQNNCSAYNNCIFSEDNEEGICSLLIPKKNLINNKDNEKIYYYKLADELLRYDHIRNYIFTNDTFLSFDKIKYNVNKNEIVLLEELLNNLLDNDIKNVKQKHLYNTNLYDNLNANINVSNTYEKKELEDKVNIDLENKVINKKMKRKIKLPPLKLKPKLPKVSTPKVSTPKVSTSKTPTPKVSTPKVSIPKTPTPKVLTPTPRTPTPEKNKKKNTKDRINDIRYKLKIKLINWLIRNNITYSDIKTDLLIKSNDFNNTDHKKLELYIKESKNKTWKELIKYRDENKLSYFFLQTTISYLKHMLNRIVKPYYKKLLKNELKGKNKKEMEKIIFNELKKNKYIPSELFNKLKPRDYKKYIVGLKTKKNK